MQQSLRTRPSCFSERLMKNPYRNVRRSMRVGAIAGSLALLSLSACGDSEPLEDLTPVSPDSIDGNDAPLANVAELKRDFPGDGSIAFEGKADVVLPTKYDLYTSMTPVKSQGSRGVC